jgi:hypothetical protein
MTRMKGTDPRAYAVLREAEAHRVALLAALTAERYNRRAIIAERS